MNICLIAHDNKKKLMQNFCIAYRPILNKHTLFATDTTGRLVEDVTGLRVHHALAGHLGGDRQLGTQIASNEMDIVIFLRDPQQDPSRDESLNTIIRLCDTHNIPIATNLATAEALIMALDRGDLEWRNLYRS